MNSGKHIADPASVEQDQNLDDASDVERLKALQVSFDALPERSRARGFSLAKLLCRDDELRGIGLRQEQRLDLLKQEFPDLEKVSPSSIGRWRKEVHGLDRSLWALALAPRCHGPGHYALCDQEAWDWFVAQVMTTSQIPVGSAYRLWRAEAKKRGWTILKYTTALARLNNSIPADVRTLARKGEKAAHAMYPAQQRRYDVEVHREWQADGRKLDLLVAIDEKRVIRIVVFVWMEVRSRYVLGYAIGETESADLVALSFVDAVKKAGMIIPSIVVVDNTMAAAAKENTGGQRRGYRFRRTEDEVVGRFTDIGIAYRPPLPRSGQSKVIERLFRTLADLVDKRAEFEGAYVGNNPTNRPENCDPRRAPPLSLVKELLDEAIQIYDNTPHRGLGLDGRTPRQALEDGLRTAVPRKITTAQMERFSLSRVKVTLRQPDHSVYVLGNRYWAPELTNLPRKGNYLALYHPGDAMKPLQLHEGTRFICEVPIRDAVGHRDKDAAKCHQRSRRQYLKGLKMVVGGMKAKVEATRPLGRARMEGVPQAPAPVKVIKMVHPKVSGPQRSKVDLPAAELEALMIARHKSRFRS